ncbi:MAG: amino acid permease [Bradymonadales bacterium]|nr:amino acid permease [Bradymonadales bacterium]
MGSNEAGDRGATPRGDAPPVQKNQFGTFGGVFTPAILTVLGVIMFMRANFVVGHAGILHAGLILILAASISFLTGLSISAISTNTPVAGGGVYFLISRSLGPEFGGAIGLTLYLAQALSVPFYVLGFTEALVSTFPVLQPHFMVITLSTATLLFVIAYVGAGWAIRVQFVVLAVLMLSVLVFLGGAALQFDWGRFSDNLGVPSDSFLSTFAQGAPEIFQRHGFWLLFAIYFPAVTGIMAGVNMSGDLKNPARSLPLGTLAAIGVGFVIYISQIILCGGAIDRGQLIADPYNSLTRLALFGAGFLVTAGVFAATLSSAIGSFVSAPRVLQALARDDLLRFVRPFSQGSTKGDEPRRALWLTLLLTVGVLAVVGGGSGGAALNLVAAIISMFFLVSYGVTNLAAFVEVVGQNPSFRPRFKYFHWAAALAGALGCIGAALAIDPASALIATIITAAIWYYVKRRGLTTSFGDARRGFTFSQVRNGLLRLEESRVDAKNWRPTILVLSGNPNTRLTLVTYGLWLGAGRGLVTMAQLLVGRFSDLVEQREQSLKSLKEFVSRNRIPAFVDVAVVPEFDVGLQVFLQSHSLGPLKPNLILFGWSDDPSRVPSFLEHLRVAAEIGMSILLLVDRELPSPGEKMRIDVWWRGRENGSLMIILAHLLASNQEWVGATIRIIRAVAHPNEREEAQLELAHLVEAARVETEVRVVVSDRPIAEVLHRESVGATVVLLGFNLPAVGQEMEFQSRFNKLLLGLPTTLLVCSSGEADLAA